MTRQRTISRPVTLKGTGLQTGSRVSITLKGSPVNSGISFVRTDLPERPALNIGSADLNDAELAQRRTSLGFGPLQVQTTEHLLAALCALGIDNIAVELDNVELPGMDGSSLEFVKAIKEAGIVEQEASKSIIDVKSPLWQRDKDCLLAIFPDEDFRVSYTLSYPGIGAQYFSIIVNEDNFTKEVAPARTFCSEAEALQLIKAGLGKGASYENTLVMGPEGPIQNSLRFADEPARHKVLDLIGDLYLAGAVIRGHVVAVKSGHRLNMELVKKLKEAI